jgi:hypothetical protein
MHILDKFSERFGKLDLYLLSTNELDDVYGQTISTQYEQSIKISGLVIFDKGNLLTKLVQDWGIQTKSTPLLIVKPNENIILGSKIYDSISQTYFEIVNHVDTITHPLNENIGYKEYDIRKLQVENSGGI